MIQKILKVGSSAAVTIPKKSLERSGLRIGDSVRVDFDEKSRRFVIEPPVKIKEELFQWTQKFIGEYRHALEELAKK